MLQEGYEEFTDNQISILEKYVTNTSSNIFALRNLPEVIKGALFSRYSRSSLGLRSLLLKEFISNTDESAFDNIVAGAKVESGTDQALAIKNAQNFYDRILDGFGDDSIGELGGAHLAIENVSMIAAKHLEDSRIGGSPLEKSTRYIYFDQKVNDEYLFYREPILMTSAYKSTYIDTCNMLFETYSKLIPVLLAKIEEQTPFDPETSKAAYNAACRAKVLDNLRGLLPTGTLTNIGLYGNGRFFDTLIHKLQCSNLSELQEIGKGTFDELTKVIPSFVKRAELTHHTHQSYAQFYESMNMEIAMVTAQNMAFPDQNQEKGVRLISYDPDSVVKVAATLLFANSNKGLDDLIQYCQELPDEELTRILDAGCSSRGNRRHKSPRALEMATFTFEILTDFGVYRDLQRHRLLTQERQLLTCDYGYFTPSEIVGMDIEKDYHEAMQKAKTAYDNIASELPEEAQYIVPMAYNIRWYFNVNLRALQWLCELRSQPAGHPNYRYVAQALAREVCRVFPAFECFFKFVDYDGYDLGRLEQEEAKIEKQSNLTS